MTLLYFRLTLQYSPENYMLKKFPNDLFSKLKYKNINTSKNLFKIKNYYTTARTKVNDDHFIFYSIGINLMLKEVKKIFQLHRFPFMSLFRQSPCKLRKCFVLENVKLFTKNNCPNLPKDSLKDQRPSNCILYFRKYICFFR